MKYMPLIRSGELGKICAKVARLQEHVQDQKVSGLTRSGIRDDLT